MATSQSNAAELTAQAERLTRIHPWLEPDLRETRDYAFTKTWRLPAPPHEVWPLISDTSRLNRALSIPRASFDEKSGRRTGESRYFRWSFIWEEPPWDWIAEQVIVCRKRFTDGPVSTVAAIMVLEPADGGTELTVWYGWTPSGILGRFTAPRLSSYLQSSYNRLIPQVQSWLSDRRDPESWPLLRRPSAVASEARDRASKAKAQLIRKHYLPEVVEGLIQHLLEGDAMDLDRLRPYRVADRLGLDRDETLRTLLAMTETGLLRVKWDVVCPHCRGPRQSLARLDELRTDARCEACDVVFLTSSERLELTFRVHEQLRHVESRLYCAAEAAMKPHVRVQLANRAPLTVALPRTPGRYLLRTADFEHQHALTLQADAPSHGEVVEGALTLAPSGTLTLPPTTSRWLLESTWDEHRAVRPRDVLSLAEYRTVMGDDALDPDMALEMGVQTLLFTDVVASTQLYRELGDHAAFRAVRSHFSVIFGHVTAEGGAVIKTIGDAVMAAFTTPEAAARAAHHIARSDLGVIRVRVSLHAGPCIAVAMDTGVDYFGSVVNEAAKLQGAAGAGEVAVSRDLALELALDGRSVEYRSGGETRIAIVWSPGSVGATPAPIRRRSSLAGPSSYSASS